jgi:superfamily II DNA or RNA helicase
MATSDTSEYDRLEKVRIGLIDHANLQIDCDRSTAYELVEFFSFFVPGYKYMPAFRNRMWDGKIRLFDQNGKLPAGLYQHLLHFCNTNQYDVDIYDTKYGNPSNVEELNFDELVNFIKQLELPFPLRDYQFEAVVNALKKKRAILVSPTGSGKSLIIYILMRYWLQMLTTGWKYPKAGRVLIVVPTTSLVEQMYNDFINYGHDEKAMHRIYSGRDKVGDCSIYISTWQSIYKLPKAWFSQFGMVVGDECHGFKSKSLMSIMNKCSEAPYRFGTTGTLDGALTHELVLQGLFGKVMKVTTTKSLQDNDTLAKLEITRLILDYDKDIKKNFGNKKYHEEIDYIVTHEKRNNLIANLTIKQKGNSLVLFQFVEKHGEPLFKLIREKAEENRKVFYVSGNIDTADREAIRKITETQENAIIVASLGTFSTGINIRNLHNIIFASPSKSQIRVLQSIGRGLRKSDNNKATKLFDLIDDISYLGRKNFALLHGFESLKIYDKEKFTHKTYKVDI